ncbi:SIMPL domain-containing protein [Mucilaginibacter angelicae]|uniref:SIMPL domain-containing protein n=1 Tax=Mucilaginibacter angelicae TaxID=869718 RepID=A0ABV6LCY5_9SPHI
MKKFLLSILLLICTTVLMAQHSGNMVFGDNLPTRMRSSIQKNYLTDSTFIIEANVLMNVTADSYVVNLGVTDSAATIQESNKRINKRIDGFTNALSKLNIAQKDIYVDMTTQNKLFDYHVKGNAADQYLKGFEIGKNVIIRIKDIKDLDNLLITASEYQIYDLVKVDYIVDDVNKVQNQLFKLATDVINEKKGLYIAATNARLLYGSQIYGEDFYSYYPNQLYKSYTAQNSSKIYSEYDRLIKKDLKNSTTYYYDKINYSGFDKIINPSVIEPAVEFVMGLQIKFQIEKVKR